MTMTTTRAEKVVPTIAIIQDDISHAVSIWATYNGKGFIYTHAFFSCSQAQEVDIIINFLMLTLDLGKND